MTAPVGVASGSCVVVTVAFTRAPPTSQDFDCEV
jgi:hypothetical protein